MPTDVYLFRCPECDDWLQASGTGSFTCECGNNAAVLVVEVRATETE